jgi:hypothetical protein
MNEMRNYLVLYYLIFSPVVSFATDYFVRSLGNDNQTGTSVNQAWQTIDKVRAFALNPGFSAGDHIYFEGGETFSTNQSIYLPCNISSGSVNDPLIFSSYGTRKALLKAKGCTLFEVWAPPSGVVKLGLKFNNLILEGDSIAQTGPKNSNGITIWNSSSSPLDYLLIEDLEIRGFAGDGINIGRDAGKGRYTNVVIKNVVSHHNPGAIGVAPHSGSGIILAGAINALIEHCIAHNNGINNNNGGGPVGIWFWDCQNSKIQYCESYENKTTNGDGGGFDLDGGCQNCIVQYCYSHDNYGAGFLFAQFSGANVYGPLSGNCIRYNISENDGRKGNYCGIYLWGANGVDQVGTNYIYNNTIYSGKSPVNGTPGCIGFLGNNMSGVKIWNNIFMTDNNHFLVNSSSAFSSTQVLFQNNVYYSNSPGGFNLRWNSTFYSLSEWRSNANGQEKIGTELAGLEIDPMFINAGNGGTINNTYAFNTLHAYKLQTNSTLIDAASDLLQPPFSLLQIGINDFYNHTIPVGGKYDFGAFDTTTSLINALTSDHDLENAFVIPNPINNSMIKVSSKLHMKSISVFKLNGETMMSKSLETKNHFQIEFPHTLSPGIYFLNIETEKGIFNKQIIVISENK